MIRFFEDKPVEFDLYGRNWEKRKFKNWRGRVEDKLEILKHYKFCICYENMRDVKGYITEKIFDSFAAGCVPVIGGDNVTKFIPEGCFIDSEKVLKRSGTLQLSEKNDKRREYTRFFNRRCLFEK